MRETTVWCEGLPLKARRRMTETEHAWLSERRRRARRLRWLLDGAGVLAFAIGIAVMFGSVRHTRNTGSNAALVGFIVFPVSLLLTWVCWRVSRIWIDRANAIAADARDGTVLLFAAASTTNAADAGAAAPAGVIEVLASGAVYAIDGVPQARWLTRPIVRTAPAPPVDAADPGVGELVHSDYDSRVTVAYRKLTAEERAELDMFVDRLKLQYVVAVPVLLAVYLGLAGNHYALYRRWWPSTAVAVAAGVAMAGAVAYLLYWIRPRIRLGRDARDASVVIIRHEVFDDGRLSEVYVSEYLQHSHLPWNQDGVAAPWRRDSELRDA